LWIPEASWANVEFESGWGAEKKHSNVISSVLATDAVFGVNLIA